MSFITFAVAWAALDVLAIPLWSRWLSPRLNLSRVITLSRPDLIDDRAGIDRTGRPAPHGVNIAAGIHMAVKVGPSANRHGVGVAPMSEA